MVGTTKHIIERTTIEIPAILLFCLISYIP